MQRIKVYGKLVFHISKLDMSVNTVPWFLLSKILLIHEDLNSLMQSSKILDKVYNFDKLKL